MCVCWGKGVHRLLQWCKSLTYCGTNGYRSCKNRPLLGEMLMNTSQWMVQVEAIYSLEDRNVTVTCTSCRLLPAALVKGIKHCLLIRHEQLMSFISAELIYKWKKLGNCWMQGPQSSVWILYRDGNRGISEMVSCPLTPLRAPWGRRTAVGTLTGECPRREQTRGLFNASPDVTMAIRWGATRAGPSGQPKPLWHLDACLSAGVSAASPWGGGGDNLSPRFHHFVFFLETFLPMK